MTCPNCGRVQPDDPRVTWKRTECACGCGKLYHGGGSKVRTSGCKNQSEAQAAFLAIGFGGKKGKVKGTVKQKC